MVFFFEQFVYYGYSVLQFSIPVMQSENQPNFLIEKITYMDGSDDVINKKLKNNSLKINSQKTIKSISINIKYEYIDGVVSYDLSNTKPQIVNENFKLNLSKVDKNYLSYTLDGDLDIVKEDISNKNGDTLYLLSCSYGYVGYSDEVTKYFKGVIDVSKKNHEKKEDLIKEIAGYYQRFEQETDKMKTYQKACTLQGMPDDITVYATTGRKVEVIEKTLTPNVIDLYSVVEDEEKNIYYIIDQSGKVVFNNGNKEINNAGIGYFYTNNADGEENPENYSLFKFNIDNKKLDFVTNSHKIISLTNNSFLIARIKDLQLFNIKNTKPIVFNGNDKSSSVNVINFDESTDRLFSFRDSEGTHIVNDTGDTVLPLAEYYHIGKGGNNTVKVSQHIYNTNIKPIDRKVYFLNPDGSIFLSITGYDNVQTINDGMIMMEKEGIHGFIDLQGREIVAPIYEDAKGFNNGYALVKKDGLWGAINKKGVVVMPFKYEKIKTMSSTTKSDSYSIDGDNYISMCELIEANGISNISGEH